MFSHQKRAFFVEEHIQFWALSRLQLIARGRGIAPAIHSTPTPTGSAMPISSASPADSVAHILIVNSLRFLRELLQASDPERSGGGNLNTFSTLVTYTQLLQSHKSSLFGH